MSVSISEEEMTLKLVLKNPTAIEIVKGSPTKLMDEVIEN